MKNISIALGGVFALIAASTVPVQADGLGTSGAQFLRITPMARPLAMGNAYTGLAEGIEALHFNPAGISSIDKWDLGLSHILMPLDASYSYVAVARRLNTKAVGALSLSYFGTEDEFRNNQGQTTGTFSNFDVGLAGTFAYDVSSEISAGGTLRIIRSELAGFDAATVGFDFGVKYRPLRWKGVSVGVILKNLGPGLEFISESSPQPLEARVGAAWQPVGRKYVIAGDVSIDREGEARANIGGEYNITDQFAVRTGFDLGQNSNIPRAWKLGMGFNSTVGSFDYAFESQEEVGNSHRFSYTYHGGRPQKVDQRDTSSFMALGRGITPPSVTTVSVLPFVQLAGGSEASWMKDGLRAIFVQRMENSAGIDLTPRLNARYLVEGQFAPADEESIWIGVRVREVGSGRTVGYQEAVVLRDDLIRGARTLAGSVIAVFPSR